MISLALAIVAVASMDQSRAALKAARSDVAAHQRDLDFDSASLEAVATIARTDGAGPFAWTIALPGGSGLEVRAEPEWQKVGPAEAKALTDPVLAQLKVKDPEALRSAFSELASQTKADAERVIKLDDAQLWRSCAHRYISVFGGSSSVPTDAPTSPLSSNGGGARVGQVWRIVLTSPLGWTDERYVRFIGDAQRPAATLERVIRREDKGADPCPSITS